ncbi:MAG TPA: hypothetical protein VMU32_09130 [Solirubrobacteraceae bacterium]|nr:hypothetical protein [Solirubrobacteraceae bacterium]
MLAASAYEIVMAVHVMAVVIAFGGTFAYPVMFAAAGRDPRGLPLLHRIEYRIERWLVNPGLLVVVAAGIFMASDGHHWSEFFVQWGLGVAVVIGALVGAVMIPTAKRAEALAVRDLATAGEPAAPGADLAAAGVRATPGAGGAAGEAGEIELSEEYRAAVRRLAIVGTVLWALVLITILFMVVKP